MGIEQEGSLSFRVNHEDKDWATNSKPYDFQPVQAGPIRAHVVKHPTQKIEIRVAGPLGAELVFEGKIPQVSPEGLHITVSWNPQEVRLFFDGKPFKTVQLKDRRPVNGGGAGSARPAPSAPPPPDA